MLQPGRLQTGKNRQIRHKQKTRKRRKINASGSRSGGIIALRLPATSIGATAHRADRLFRLRKPPTRFPPPEVVGGFPHGFTGRVSGSLPPINKNPDNPRGVSGFLCRSGGIRTRGLLVPNQTRYQTALHLDAGADEGTRTPDLLITNRLLYQLSHIGTTSNGYYNKGTFVCPALFFIGSGHPQTGVIGYTATQTGKEGPP